MIEASVAMPYSAGEVASKVCPCAAISRSAAPWKSPSLNRPLNISGQKPMPPNAHGPITMPAASSPRIDGSFIIEASAPPTFAAKMMMPICNTRNIISSVRGNPKFG